jgi:hypothetical protein
VLPLAFVRLLVVSHSGERGVAEQSVGRKLAKAHLDDVTRLDPRGRFRIRNL